MDIYTRKSRLKLYLGAAGAIIVAISMLYTNYLTGKLADEERKKVSLYLRAMEDLSDTDDEDAQFCDFTLHFQILQSNTTIPVMVVNDRGGIDDFINIKGDTSTLALQKEVEKMKEEGFEPIEGFAYSIYYKESTLLKQLRYFPLVQLILIAAFVGFGYMGFNSARRAEQNRVWVGMAKETAHQLGTPISAIVAWIEHLKMIREDDEETQEVLGELRNDVSRLELIADRFSKIGSAPKLEPVNVYEELDRCRVYMQRRASRKVAFDFPEPNGQPEKTVRINPHLFDWVVENLLRNALDAMESTGKISAEVYEDSDYIYIDISDTGKGIPASKFKTVFQPGFTTKKRGWGLGLSLAKRIVEDYHKGKIFVKRSEEGQGTTFTIQMPKS
ncbi:MAG: HAMP domain-containing histidine kinase [Lewinellaceae bacterium]|nr:HAMP domain-containing histidine kinase [Lewinellaceae bacterium]